MIMMNKNPPGPPRMRIEDIYQARPAAGRIRTGYHPAPPAGVAVCVPAWGVQRRWGLGPAQYGSGADPRAQPDISQENAQEGVWLYGILSYHTLPSN